MFEWLGVLVPLALVAMVILFIVHRARKTSVALPPDFSAKGLGGWLSFYIVMSSVMGPLITAAKLSHELNKAVADAPTVTSLPTWSTYVSMEWTVVAMYVAWLWWVNYGLVRHFLPSSVRRVKVFLVASPLTLALSETVAAYVLFGLDATADVLSGMGSTVLPTLVWFGYFNWSKRVRATYYDNFLVAALDDVNRRRTATS